ncbi:MAG: 5'-nucleotidase C-terminal domain-containing protein [Fimbriimonadaceae bacterium]|nr:5'-nucleotidase C-terminal domain-containing protein [Chitinophagales bacterium]
MKQHCLLYSIFFFLILQFSCSHYTQINYNAENLRINSAGEDSSIIKIIQPYKNELSGEMNEVIGYVEADMRKMKPESGLGNFVCDVLLKEGVETYNMPIDFAVYNYGGIRLDAIYAGVLTRGKIFELLPFENFGVIVTLDAESTARLIQKIVDEGGWPVAGISFFIESGKAYNIKINNMPFDTTATYRVIMNDYMANGGDKLDFLVDKENNFLGATIRDIVLNYIEKENAAGKNITTVLDGRIKYAE